MLHLLFWWLHLIADPSWAEGHPKCLNLFLCALAVNLCVSCPILCCRSWLFNPGCRILLLFIPVEFYLWGWGMHASVCWCVHSCFLLHQRQVLGPSTVIPRQIFLGRRILTCLFRLLFSKRNRNQVLWQWPLNSRVRISPNRWINFKVSS